MIRSVKRSVVVLSVLAAGSIGVAGGLVGCNSSVPAAGHSAAAVLNGYNAENISEATQTSSFGGYSISPTSRTVIAYRTAAATSDDLSAVQGVGLPAGFSLRVKAVQRSWTMLERLEETLPAHLPSSLEPLLSEVDIDAEANGLDVGLTSVSPSSKADLRKVLGDSLAKVFRADRVIAS